MTISAQLATLEQSLPKTPADWARFIVEMNQWRSTLQGQTWQALSLKNNWVPYGTSAYVTPQYYVDVAGRVFCRGLIKSGTLTDGTVLFSFPFAPSFQVITLAPAYSGSAYASPLVDVTQAGNAVIYNASSFSGAYWISLDQLSFSLIQ